MYDTNVLRRIKATLATIFCIKMNESSVSNSSTTFSRFSVFFQSGTGWIRHDAKSVGVGSCLYIFPMADLQRPKKYGRPAYNPARFPEHHLLYKELIPYFDFLHNIGFNNLPGQLNLPQPGFNLPISSSHSHRAIFTPLDLRYVAGSASAPSVSSSGHRGTYTNVSNVNAVSNSDVGVNRTGPAERDLLPSDALRNLYRLAERVYSHLDVVLDGKNHQRTGLQGQNGNTRNDKSIENAARPAARDGSIHAPGGYSTESQVNIPWKHPLFLLDLSDFSF